MRGSLPNKGGKIRLTILFLAKADEGAFTEVAMLLEQGNPEVMTAVVLTLLMELEQMAPTTADTSDEALAASPVGCLVAAMLVTPSARTKSLLLDVGEKLQVLGFYRRAGFIYAQLLPL